MEHGTKELKELVLFVGALASATDMATKDGLGIADIALFMPALLMAPEAMAGLDKAKLEAGDLSIAEMDELKVALAGQLDLADDKLEALVEKSIGVLINIYGIVEEIKTLKA